jgi:hypothetical protein
MIGVGLVDPSGTANLSVRGGFPAADPFSVDTAQFMS